MKAPRAFTAAGVCLRACVVTALIAVSPIAVPAGAEARPAMATAAQPAWLAANGSLKGADVFALARDPDRPAIRYAGTSTGFARTMDNGATWQALNAGLPPDCQVYALTAVRRSSGTLLAGCHGSLYADGIYRSADRGAHWTASMQGMTPNDAPWSLMQGPGDQGPLFAAMSDGIYRSDDGAASWQRVLVGAGFTLSAYSLAKDPFSPLVYYAITSNFAYRSEDGGFTWFPSANGLESLDSSTLNQIVADPTRKGRLFIATSNDGIWQSIDGGASWQSLDGSPQHVYSILVQPLLTIPRALLTPDLRYLLYPPVRKPFEAKLDAHGNVIFTTAPPKRPTDTAMIVVGTDSGVQSSIAGADWSDRTADANSSLPSNAKPYPDLPQNSAVYALLSFGRSSEVLAGTAPGGVYRSTDLARSWNAGGPGLTQNLAVTAIALDPAAPGTVYYATQGGGVEKSTSSSANITAANDGLPANAAVNDLLLEPGQAPRLVAALGAPSGGVAIVDHGDQSWQLHRLGGHFVNVVIADPHDPDTLYAGLARGGVAWSEDGGSTWRVLHNGLDPAASVVSLAADPHNALHLLAATDQGLFVSEDQGQTWAAVSSSGLPGEQANMLLVDPTQRGLILAGTGEGLYRSVDGGAQWSAVANELSGTAILRLTRDPLAANTLLAATSSGVYRTTDGGVSWSALDRGFPAIGSATAVAAAGAVAYAATAYGVYFLSPAGPVPALVGGGVYFSAFGHSIQEPFLSFWRAYGGVTVFGYPRTEALQLGGRTVQYFQRARLEYSAADGVTLTPLGLTFTRRRQFGHLKPFKDSLLRVYIAQTRHSLSEPLLSYWKKHGGAAVFGYPISEVLYEENGDGTGQSYTLQYFQNARLELHPENKGTPYAIQLGLLGEQALRGLGWLQ